MHNGQRLNAPRAGSSNPIETVANRLPNHSLQGQQDLNEDETSDATTV